MRFKETNSNCSWRTRWNKAPVGGVEPSWPSGQTAAEDSGLSETNSFCSWPQVSSGVYRWWMRSAEGGGACFHLSAYEALKSTRWMNEFVFRVKSSGSVSALKFRLKTGPWRDNKQINTPKQQQTFSEWRQETGSIKVNNLIRSFLSSPTW